MPVWYPIHHLLYPEWFVLLSSATVGGGGRSVVLAAGTGGRKPPASNLSHPNIGFQSLEHHYS